MKRLLELRGLMGCFVAVVLIPRVVGGQPVFTQHLVAERPRPVVTEPGGQVMELIRDLSDGRLSKRREASRLLLEMGPAIEPQLRGALQQEEPAPEPAYTVIPGAVHTAKLAPESLLPRYAFNALDEIISRLEEQRHLKASVITLHYAGAPLIDVLRDLGAQADMEAWFGSWYNLTPLDWIKTNRVTLDLERVSYWEALRALEKSAGLGTINPNGQNRPIFTKQSLVKPPESTQSPATRSAVSGPFQITPASVEVSRRLEYGERKKSAELKLVLEVRAEPKVWSTGIRALARLEKCVDERGQSLLLKDKQSFPSAESGMRCAWTIAIDLDVPRAGRRIKELKGKLSVAVGLGQRYLAITNLLDAQDQSREFDGLTINVRRVAAADQHYDLDVALSALQGSPYATTFSGREQPNLALWDQTLSGILRPDLFMSPNWVHHEQGVDVASWHLSCNRAPATLTWLTPEETRWLMVEFELRDLGVP